MLGVGWSGAAGVHNLIARPKLGALRGDFGPIMAIGFPAIMANMAAPVSSAYTLRIFSDFGEAAIAAFAIIDRVTPWPSASSSRSAARSVRSSVRMSARG